MQSLELMALFSAVFSDVLPPRTFSFVVCSISREDSRSLLCVAVYNYNSCLKLGCMLFALVPVVGTLSIDYFSMKENKVLVCLISKSLSGPTRTGLVAAITSRSN